MIAYTRNRRSFVKSIVGIGVMAVVSGVVHGKLDGRWDSAPKLAETAKIFDTLPNQVGDWLRTDDQPLPEAALRVLRCHRYVTCQYRNAVTGRELSMALLFGPRGPIAVHTPEICYPGQGIQTDGDRSELVMDRHSFWNIGFNVNGLPHSRVYYAWSDGNAWVASKYPRVWPVANLFKVQVAANPTTDDGEDFLKAFVHIWDTNA